MNIYWRNYKNVLQKIQMKKQSKTQNNRAHPIFNQSYTIYTMVAQDEDTILSIDMELKKKLKFIKEIEHELSKLSTLRQEFNAAKQLASELSVLNSELEQKLAKYKMK